MTSTLDLEKNKSKGGRPPSSIWKDAIRGNPVSSGKYHATCKYCNFLWLQGDISKLEEHFANYCSEASGSVVRKYLNKILERKDKVNKKRKIVRNNQLTMTDYHDSNKISDGRELNSLYKLPTREFLSDQLLERELAMMNSTVTFVIENGANLTLVFDDLSEHSHTGNYIAEVIEEVIEKIGPNKISAILSDNASKVRNACKIIEEKYPNIENVRCIAHAINFITCDILKESFRDRLLRKVNTLASLFKNSHQAGAKLIQLIKENSIHGGGIKLYLDSVIMLEPVLEQIITNENPLRKAVLALESRSVMLGDCFLSLIQLLAVLKKLPKSFNQNFYLRFRSRPLTTKAYSKIVRYATTIGKRLGFNLKESRALCKQIKDYRNNKPPFDLDESCSLDDPLNWWNLIDINPQLNSLPLAVCPNFASCE
ncbi:hypothetical protein RhiirC2_774208 [Rhizophagus irregularis]|uniref:DUF659 domain-containing protein n=1 Tax=Rhizophagus irregularis TaxID=588596 RepID=A0A2N1NLY7_9GLOM|nr:hypothetical protein RhiirC2_774208 [Rhizophagus irregularis]